MTVLSSLRQPSRMCKEGKGGGATDDRDLHEVGEIGEASGALLLLSK